MTMVQDVCHQVRSKNAGPFWVTIDLFFNGPDDYARHASSPALNATVVARLYGLDAAQVQRHFVPALSLLKISFPRATPQGGVTERDLHSGQMFVRLLNVGLDADPDSFSARHCEFGPCQP